MQRQLFGLVGWLGFALAAAGALQACGDNNKGHVASGGAEAGAGGTPGEAGVGAAAPSAGGGNSSAGGATGGSAAEPDAGAPGNAGMTSSSADGGEPGSAGASSTSGCHISWTGGETGHAGCPSLHVCHKNFLSLNLGDPDPPTPLKSIQLVYSPDHDLSLGTFMATGLDMVNCNVQTPDSGESYSPQLDQDNMLTGGSALTVTLTELSFSTDAVDVCAGTAHGSLDVVLPASQGGVESLTLHAEF